MPHDLKKFSSQMNKDVLAELREYSKESNRQISGILTDAVSSYLESVRLRPAFRKAANEVVEENRELLQRLAR